MAWRTASLLLVLATLLPGCSDSGSTGDAPTPTVRRVTTDLTDPITESEISVFLSVVENLPGSHPPEFAPLAQATADEKLSAGHLVEVYRQEFRAMFDASRHGSRWRDEQPLMKVFEKHSIEPEEFAALMMRMSCAVAASKMSSRDDMLNASSKAEIQVTHLSSQVDRLNAGPRTPESIDRRMQLLDTLQELVALSEFSRLLNEVPDESIVAVREHQSELARLLPQSGGSQQFERVIESKVVPTSFERPAAR